ncbi:MAG: hypothetical protein ACLSE6_05005 [Alphaproteobacteria bacterium]
MKASYAASVTVNHLYKQVKRARTTGELFSDDSECVIANKESDVASTTNRVPQELVNKMNLSQQDNPVR